MIIIDYVILVILGLSGFLGYRSGLFKKIFGIVSFIVALIVATKLMSPLGRSIANSFGFSIEISYVLGFFLVFVSTIVIQNIISRKIGDWGGGVNIANRLGGVFLGLLQGTLLASLLLLMLSIFSTPSETTRTQSLLYKPVLNFAPLLFDLSSKLLPESKSFYEELRRDLKYKVHSL